MSSYTIILRVTPYRMERRSKQRDFDCQQVEWALEEP